MTQDEICWHCGSVCDQDAQFCTKCGKKREGGKIPLVQKESSVDIALKRVSKPRFQPLLVRNRNRDLLVLRSSLIIVILLCAAAFVTTPTSNPWQVEIIDKIGNPSSLNDSFSSPALAIDHSGSQHVTYAFFQNGQYGIKYGYKDNTGWHVETLSSVSKDKYNSTMALTYDVPTIAIDSSNYPHIAYSDRYPRNTSKNATITYVHKDQAGWHSETVTGTQESDPEPVIALDSHNRPDILYSDWGNVSLFYAYRDDAGWHREPINDAEAGQEYTLVLDSADKPNIAYTALTPGTHNVSRLKWSYKDVKGWHTEVVAQDSRGFAIDLALDSVNNPHITYWGESGLTYAFKDGQKWRSETVYNTEAFALLIVYGRPSIVVDQSNMPSIAYCRGGEGQIQYAHKVGSDWQIDTLSIIHNIFKPLDVSLALSSSGTVSVAYEDEGTRTVQLGTIDSSSIMYG